MFSKMATLTFFAGTSAVVYAQTKKARDEAQLRAIVPYPLPCSELSKVVVEASQCEQVAPKPAGDLSGSIVLVRPFSPSR